MSMKKLKDEMCLEDASERRTKAQCAAEKCREYEKECIKSGTKQWVRIDHRTWKLQTI